MNGIRIQHDKDPAHPNWGTSFSVEMRDEVKIAFEKGLAPRTVLNEDYFRVRHMEYSRKLIAPADPHEDKWAEYGDWVLKFKGDSPNHDCGGR